MIIYAKYVQHKGIPFDTLFMNQRETILTITICCMYKNLTRAN